MRTFFKAKELDDGIWENNIQVVPPFSETLLRNLRQAKKIVYRKQGRECIFTKKDLLDYLNSTKVEVA